MKHYFCDGDCQSSTQRQGVCTVQVCYKFGRDLEICECLDNSHGIELISEPVEKRFHWKRGHIHPLSMGLALGCALGGYIFFLGLVAWIWNYGTFMLNAFAHLYVGYSATLLGSFIGLAWGFVDGFIGGVFFAALYNFFARKRLH